MFGKKFSKEPTEKQKIGQIGEDFACEYLKKIGYEVIERNYLKKWGEIDIVTKKGNKLHFIEVKSVSRLLGESADEADQNVPRVTPVAEQSSLRGRQNDNYNPEDNMHPWKLQRLSRTIQSYLLDKDIPDNIDWQFDLVTVYIDLNKGRHKVNLLEDIVL